MDAGLGQIAEALIEFEDKGVDMHALLTGTNHILYHSIPWEIEGIH